MILLAWLLKDPEGINGSHIFSLKQIFKSMKKYNGLTVWVIPRTAQEHVKHPTRAFPRQRVWQSLEQVS